MTAVQRMLQTIWTTLREVVHRDFWWAEFFSGLGLCSWAILVIKSNALVERNFGPLLLVANEHTWENVAFAIGFAQFASLISDIWWLRASVAWFAGTLLGCILLNFSQLGHYPPPATGFYFAALATNVMAMYKNIVRPGVAK